MVQRCIQVTLYSYIMSHKLHYATLYRSFCPEYSHRFFEGKRIYIFFRYVHPLSC